MVPGQSMSPGRGRRVRALRSSAPRTAWRVRCSSRASSSRTRSPTTRRAVSRLFAGTTSFSASSVVTSSRSGSTVSSSSGSSRSWRRPARSMASRCTTRTTLVGKRRRTSPSQRATRGAEAPSPPARPPSSSSVVEGAQGGVELGVAPLQRAVGGVVGRLAEHQAPAPARLLGGDAHRAASGRPMMAASTGSDAGGPRLVDVAPRLGGPRATAHRSGARPRRRSGAARPRRSGRTRGARAAACS